MKLKCCVPTCGLEDVDEAEVKKQDLPTIDKERKFVETQECKILENLPILDANSEPIYVLQHKDGFNNPKVIVLQPIKKDSKIIDDVPQSTPEVLEMDVIPDLNLIEIINEPVLYAEITPESPQVETCDVEMDIPSLQTPKKSYLESVIRPPAFSTTIIPTSNKIELEPRKKCDDKIIEPTAQSNTEDEGDWCIKRYTVEGKRESDANNVDKVISNKETVIGRKDITKVDNCSHNEVKKMNSVKKQGAKPDVKGLTEAQPQKERQVKICSCMTKDSSRITINEKSLNHASAPHARELTLVELESIKKLMKSYQEEYTDLKMYTQSLKSKLKKYKRKIRELESAFHNAERITRIQAFDLLTRGMNDDAKLLIKMQMDKFDKKSPLRRFSFKEKFFALTIYKCCKKAYSYLSTVLALPNPSKLDRFMCDLRSHLVNKKGTRISKADDRSQDKIDEKVPDNLKNKNNENELESGIDQISTGVGYLEYSDKGTYVSVNNYSDDVIYVDHNEYSGETRYHDNEESEILLCNQNAAQDPESQNEKIVKEISNNNKVGGESTLKAGKKKRIKVNKIDSILSKMMTAEELKKLVNISELRQRVGVGKRKNRLTRSRNSTSTINKGKKLNPYASIKRKLNMKIEQNRAIRNAKSSDYSVNKSSINLFSNEEDVKQKNLVILNTKMLGQRKRKNFLEEDNLYIKTKPTKVPRNSDFMLDVRKMRLTPSLFQKGP